ncbi:UPF0488 protein C8orf33 homolog isoform X2 [Mixophyes fleayi]|uniref:UPF0488 protein C8orf33 homolog isoform X2 n=1 Tax=Mixophyes fleayi TaxID=3061075 RepID=UPI003F4E4377
MEQAPQGTFEDELDWCIRQLESGLLRRNPTPNQVSDTQRILRVLRSRKAPFVKKRQVMNQVFGNYRVKMADERRTEEKSVQIQEVTSQEEEPHSVVYRKCARDIQEGPGHWFTASNNNFSFNFCPDQVDPSKESGCGGVECKQVEEVECKDQNISGHGIALCAGAGSEFTFDFQIPGDAGSPSQSSEGHISTQDASGDQLNVAQTSPAVAESLPQNCPNLEDACALMGVAVNRTIKLEANGKNAFDSPKKKKKKKTKNQSAQTRKVEEHRGDAGSSSSPKEDPQAGADELRRELDWCVEQLRLGLQRQKSTPKQVEEALRAIKTLSGEKVPLVKKRQLMRAMFGDYRRKMEEERLKQLKLMQAAAKSAQVSEVTAAARRNSSKVFRKSSHKPSRIIGQSDVMSAGSQGSCDLPTVPGTSNEGGFTFRSSQEPFCFNFF